MPIAARRTYDHRNMFSDMNVTPFIDVLLVLLIMFIMVIPMATHALLIPLPTDTPSLEIRPENTVGIDAGDHLYWNGQQVDRQVLLNQLAGAAAMNPEPLVRFEPDAKASYQTSARTIALIKDAGVERFAFIGNHRHREFGRAGE